MAPPHLGNVVDAAGCEWCKTAELNRTSRPGRYVDVKDLREGRRKKSPCSVCALILRAVAHLEIDESKPEITMVLFQTRPTGITVSTYGERRRSGTYMVDLFTEPGSPPCELPFVSVQLTRRDTWMPFVRKSMAHCEAEHADCTTIISAVKLPTRVLDVGDGDNSDVRIYESRGEEAPYTALSYCWGGQVPITTTRATLATRRAGIPWADLPAAFHDAIAVTRALGIRYIWIDALCILQDDKEDWEVESGRMTAIYHRAALVIGASMAGSSLEPILDRAVPTPDAEDRIVALGSLGNSDGTTSLVHAQVRADHQLTSPTLFGGNVGDTGNKLASRAWTLQEQLLATRMLHFLPADLVWECRSGWCCECRLPEAGPGMAEAATYKRDLEVEAEAGEFDFWRQVRANYIGRSLTYGADFLPALSGVVAHLQRHGAGEYLAGIWARHLVVELCWATATGQDGSAFARASPYRAPSWSWASLEQRHGPRASVNLLTSESHYRLYGGVTVCEVLEARCDRAGKDPNGAVDFGCVVLRGRLLPLLSSSGTGDDDEVCWLEGVGDDGNGRWTRASFDMDSMDSREPRSGVLGVLLYYLASFRMASKFCGVLVRAVDASSARAPWGLAAAVKEAHGVKDGMVFERVGTFDIYGSGKVDEIFSHAPIETVVFV